MINKDFNSVIELIEAFPTEQKCIDHLEQLRWNGNVVSPFDENSIVYKCSKNRYRCKETGKYFNVKTATLFDNSKVPLQKWFLAIWLVTSHKKGISSLQLGRDIDVTQKTAWFMLQRIRNCFGFGNEGELGGEVEVDETFIGGRAKNKHLSKKIGDDKGGSGDKSPVIGMVERKGTLVAKQIPNVKGETLTKQMVSSIKIATTVYSDEYHGYKKIKAIYDHKYVKHSAGQYVNDRVHTNTIEGFWSLLKRGIIGIYHFTSNKHLQKYVDEFVFRYNSRNFSEKNRFNLLLTNTEHRLTYNKLING